MIIMRGVSRLFPPFVLPPPGPQGGGRIAYRGYPTLFLSALILSSPTFTCNKRENEDIVGSELAGILSMVISIGDHHGIDLVEAQVRTSEPQEADLTKMAL